MIWEKQKSAGKPAHQCVFRKLQAGEHGSVVLVVQIGADLAGLGATIVDGGEKEIGAAQHSGNEEDRHHKKGLAFKNMQDGEKGGFLGSALQAGGIIARKKRFVHRFF